MSLITKSTKLQSVQYKLKGDYKYFCVLSGLEQACGNQTANLNDASIY